MGTPRTEMTRPPCRHNLPPCPSLEQYRLVSWSGAIRKRADRKGRLVLISSEQVVQAFVAKILEELFSVD